MFDIRVLFTFVRIPSYVYSTEYLKIIYDSARMADNVFHAKAISPSRAVSNSCTANEQPFA